MSIRATVVGQLTVVETLASGIDGVADPTLTYSSLNFSHTCNATTTITGTKVAADTSALSGGAATIDLTSLPTVNTTQSFSGLKLRGYLFSAPSTNGASITIAEGASNGYPLGDSIVLKPGQEIVKWMDDEESAISGTDKTLDLAGTGTDAFSYVLIAG